MSRPLQEYASSPAALARAPAASRRPPPDQSVSLRQPSARRTLPRRIPGRSNPPSAASSLINHRDSSGESSNVDNWFNNSNNNLAKDGMPDNEPPFYFRNNSSSESPPDYPDPRGGALPFRTSLNPMNSTGSSSEEYRGVIDDLTVQNKRLKKKLRRYERTHESQSLQDRLFEVRVHGLQSHKKRELEDLLRDFARSLGKEADDDIPLSGDVSQAPSALPTKPTSSLASTRFADSGYGSMTTPNVPHGASLAGALATTLGDAERSSHANGKTHNVPQSHLRNVPASLLPRPHIGLSERAKKKLVVRRLEQIFQGRGAIADANQQPSQQQHVSHLAAKDDAPIIKPAAWTTTSCEGVREARIMQSTNGDSSPDKAEPSIQPPDGDSSYEKQDPNADSSKPPVDAQRPTRPLDLDPSRAQVPWDNMEYIRHLGFDVPDPGSQTASPTDGEGWIYLNLLINMAQLHTISVTPDFVKHAVSDFSSDLELSSDGRKVRWRAKPALDGAESGNTASESNDSPPDVASPNARTGHKRKHMGSAPTVTGGAPLNKKAALDSRKTTNFVYAPLFHRQEESEDEEGSLADYESSQSSPELAETAALPRGPRGSKIAGQSQGEGPIIFYNNPYFCTDLSGDSGLTESSFSTLDRQHLVSSIPVGISSPRRRNPIDGDANGPAHRRYFEGDAEAAFATTMSEASVDLSRLELDISSRTPKRVSFADDSDTVEFEATGLGGVIPADNLVIAVVKEHRPRLGHRKVSTLRPPQTRLDGILQRGAADSRINDRIVSARTAFLEPSTLPEPSMAFDTSDLTEDEEAEEAENFIDPSFGAFTESIPIPDLVSVGPLSSFKFSTSANSMASEMFSEGSSIEAESGSQVGGVDFLDMARRADPEAVRAMEREYDAEMAERLAEEIPAGSSAATAGGGSNNPSPMGPLEATTVAKEIYGATHEDSSRDSEADAGDDRSISS